MGTLASVLESIASAYSASFHKIGTTRWNIGGGLAYVAVTLLLASVSGPFQEMAGEGLFATLVITAVATTLMASPLFDRLVRSKRTRVRPLSGPVRRVGVVGYLWKGPKVKPHL